MFVGHYAVSLALKSVEKKASLGLLFIAVQFLDIVFFPLTLLGVEKFRLVENFTESSHFELLYMPFSHSLFAVILWTIAIFVLIRYLLVYKSGKHFKVAAVLALAVFSHWWLDLIVHTPDLPLTFADANKYGFGLWQHAFATYLLEAVLLIFGLFFYMKSTANIEPTSGVLAKYGMPIFVVLLLAINVINIFGPLSAQDTNQSMAVSALAAYFILAVIAWWVDRKRQRR
ncbi:permease [Thalassotalea insulae]|uniref:Permease n=1 Tax=Thalassotalea insulae TaxID=2056778 RepID=A0ABQ6GQK9_9GAMM|nr:hypothetical protein [Thalassotalea insulae]GLX78248.1 permease [Thalassotalea insulae]